MIYRFMPLLQAALMLFFMAFDLSAAPVDATAAQAVAVNFLQSRQSDKLLSGGNADLKLAHTEPSSTAADMIDYYVFNATDGTAFVIIAGDDRAKQVLGYGEGALDMNDIPDNMRWWLDQYKRQLTFLRTQPPRQANEQQAEEDSLTVEPLLTCKWSQEEPYNSQCPAYENSLCYTGCTATAMAQVLYYWKYPAQLPALQPYTTWQYRIEVEGLPAVAINWDLMKDVYNFPYSDQERNEIATLMRYCGQACSMDYTPMGSAASCQQQLMAFKKFGYNKGAKTLLRDDYSDEQWKSMINSELAAGHPIPYSGSDSIRAHIFVLDGCDNGMYHFNWGWKGLADGYFALDALEPIGYVFSYMQKMNYQLFPDDNQSVPEPAYDFEVDDIYYLKNGTEATVTYRDGAFNSYSGDVVIPEVVSHDGETYQVTCVAEYAFAGCDSLTSIQMPFIKRLESHVFICSPSLHSITIGKALESSSPDTFLGLVGLNKLEIQDLDAWASKSFSRMEDSPMSYARHLYHDGQPVTDLVIHSSSKRIGNYVFFGCSDLKSLIVEKGVESIGYCAFYGCENLERVEFAADSVLYGAFFNCTNINECVMHEGVKMINDYAFCYGGMTSLTLPQSLDSIGECAFRENNRLEDLEFKCMDVTLGEYAFAWCPVLSSLKFSPSQTSIGYAAFACCQSLQDIDLGQSMQTIGAYAFGKCTALGEITLPPTVAMIDEGAFSGCTGLSHVNISDLASWCTIDFKNVSANPLVSAQHLFVADEEISGHLIIEEVDSVGAYAFYTWNEINRLTIGDSVQAVGDNAFSQCGNLTSITIGDDVQSIGYRSFYKCLSLDSLTLGRSLTNVGNQAFISSNNIRNITSKPAIPPTLAGKNCFSAFVYKKAALRVPIGSVEDYQADEYWKQFINIEGAVLDWTAGDVNLDGEVTVADVNAVISQIFDSATAMPSADVNGDGEVSIADINAIIDMLLSVQ